MAGLRARPRAARKTRDAGARLMRAIPTPWHTIGPFFPRTFFRDGDNDLTRGAARGQRIVLRGRVLEEGGAPCVNAVLEAWQADAEGRFAHPLDPEGRDADP